MLGEVGKSVPLNRDDVTLKCLFFTEQYNYQANMLVIYGTECIMCYTV